MSASSEAPAGCTAWFDRGEGGGTPLSSFSKILATSDRQDVFNGYCGAESGYVPVSAVSPALLISEIEIQKTNAGQDLLPLRAIARPRNQDRRQNRHWRQKRLRGVL